MNTRLNSLIAGLVLAASIAIPSTIPSNAHAAASAKACAAIFQTRTPVSEIVIDDAYQQWLLWEQTANLSQFAKPTVTIDVPVARLPSDAVIVRTTNHAPANLINAFVHGATVLWPQHPYNTASAVPYKDAPAVGNIPVYMTSSRSLALSGELRGFTIKIATNFPHGPKGEEQYGKIKTNDDIDSALIHTSHVESQDAILGADPTFDLLGEVMTMAEKKTGIGMVVRDVRLLDDGHYYLPALSIPYVGREIAAVNGEEFGAFWGEHFARALGEVKARLLLRYGLQMLTPNSQNILIQMDRNLRPTGKLILRDISDAYLVDPVAKGLEFDAQIKLDNSVEYPPVKELKPYWSNSSWRMDEAGTKSVPAKMAGNWGVAHNKAYVEFIEKELGVNFKLAPMDLAGDTFPGIYRYLSSPEGQAKLHAYAQKHSAAHIEKLRTKFLGQKAS